MTHNYTYSIAYNRLQILHDHVRKYDFTKLFYRLIYQGNLYLTFITNGYILQISTNTKYTTL